MAEVLRLRSCNFGRKDQSSGGHKLPIWLHNGYKNVPEKKRKTYTYKKNTKITSKAYLWVKYLKSIQDKK